MNQILFLFTLYVLGVSFGLLFKRDVPILFIAFSGFMWGVLFWVVGGIVLQILDITYSLLSMGMFLLLIGAGIVLLHFRFNTLQFSGQDSITILLVAVSFLLVLYLASQFNLAVASPDSGRYIATGRKIAYQGFSSSVREDLSLRGIFLFQLQSASVLLGEEYLSISQPAFGYTFIMIFYALNKQVISYLCTKKRFVMLLSNLATLGLSSTYFFIFQFFYIHNNLISTVYLLAAIAGFWLANMEGKNAWTILAVMALMGYSLVRTEAPVYAMVFLIPLISAGKIPYRIRLTTLLPFLIALIFWYIYLLLGIGDSTRILNPGRIYLIVGSLAAIVLLVIFSEVGWIKRFVLPHLPKIMLGTLILVLVAMTIQKPNHMRSSVYAIIVNMLQTGEWGIIWFIFLFLTGLSLTGPRLPFEEIFFFSIPSFFFVLLALSYFRVSYRTGWGDSANRMLTQILPIIITYVTMKSAEGLRISVNGTEKENKKGYK